MLIRNDNGSFNYNHSVVTRRLTHNLSAISRHLWYFKTFTRFKDRLQGRRFMTFRYYNYVNARYLYAFANVAFGLFRIFARGANGYARVIRLTIRQGTKYTRQLRYLAYAIGVVICRSRYDGLLFPFHGTLDELVRGHARAANAFHRSVCHYNGVASRVGLVIGGIYRIMNFLFLYGGLVGGKYCKGCKVCGPRGEVRLYCVPSSYFLYVSLYFSMFCLFKTNWAGC